MSLDGVDRRRQASRQTIAERAPVRRRNITWIDAKCFDCIDLSQHGLHPAFAFNVQQNARARANAWDTMHAVLRRAGLQHQELPARRAEIVGLPEDAREAGAWEKECAALPVIESMLLLWSAKAQVEVDALLDKDDRDASKWSGARSFPERRT
jgi:hypothetical protein